MRLVDAIELLAEQGASVDMIVAYVRRHEAEREVSISDRRAKDAERQRRKRYAESRGHDVTSRDSARPSPSRTRVVIPSLSSFPSETQKEVKTSEAKVIIFPFQS